MKRSKQDKQFWIQLDQSNRDFLSFIATFMLSYAISLISLLISVIAIIIAINGISSYTIGAVIFFGAIMIIASFWFSKKVKKTLKDTKALNEQLQKELTELYPEYNNKFR